MGDKGSASSDNLSSYTESDAEPPDELDRQTTESDNDELDRQTAESDNDDHELDRQTTESDNDELDRQNEESDNDDHELDCQTTESDNDELDRQTTESDNDELDRQNAESDAAQESTDNDEFNLGTSFRRVTPRLHVNDKELFYKSPLKRAAPILPSDDEASETPSTCRRTKFKRNKPTSVFGESNSTVDSRKLLKLGVDRDSHDDSSTDDEDIQTGTTRRQQQNALILERRLNEKIQGNYSASDSDDDHEVRRSQPITKDIPVANAEGKNL